ncbi:MAG: MFS transporter [Candidatus Thorarchaeota archaeon]|nr:MFS transporter [Candidatus Thorarchaeota archaeon]
MNEDATSNATDTLQVGPYMIVLATGFGVFLSALDSSIVNVSLWTMAESFGVGMAEIQWVTVAYLLVLTSMMPLAGKMGDRYGKTRVFKFGILFFTIGSLTCALSSSLIILIASRVFQAFGSSMMTATGLALITYFTTSENRGRAIGLNSVVLATALGLGPVLGGILTEFFGWESIFLVNLPVGLVGFAIVTLFIPSTEHITEVHFDTIGAGLFFLSLFSLVYAASLGVKMGLEFLLLLIGISVLAFAGLFVREKRFISPIIPTTVMMDRHISISLVTALFSFMAIAPVTFLLPFLFQDALGISQSMTGVFLAIQPIVFSVSGPLAGLLSERITARSQTMIGLVVQLVGLIALGLVAPDLILMGLSIVVMATGLSLFTVANGNFIMTSAPKQYLGVVSALTNIARTTGFSVAIALATTFFSWFFSIINPTHVSSGSAYISYYTLAISWSFWAFALLLIFAIVLTPFRGLSPSETERTSDEPIDE